MGWMILDNSCGSNVITGCLLEGSRKISIREREKVEGQSRDQKGEKMLSGYEDERRGHKPGNIGDL